MWQAVNSKNYRERKKLKGTGQQLQPTSNKVLLVKAKQVQVNGMDMNDVLFFVTHTPPEAGSDQIEVVGATRGPPRPKRLVVATQGQGGRPATGSRRRTLGKKFTSTLSDCQTGALRPSARMSLAVTQCVETADSELTRVVEMRPGWLKTAYAQRGDALAKLNVVEFVDKIGMPAAEQPSEPPMRNYRYYFDMPKFAELRTAAETDPAIDQQIAAEKQAMPAGSCTPSWFLNQYQLKECGLCGTREGKLSICNGCRSFVYCCSEHQAPLAGF